jgi:hypothetical protein
MLASDQPNMQSRSITAIVVFLLVVAALSVAGCTASDISQSSPSKGKHDAFLENYLETYKNSFDSDPRLNVKAWELTWINSTSAQLEVTCLSKTTNTTVNFVETLIVFPSTKNAANYLDEVNKTAYSLATTQYPNGGIYQLATGNVPQVYRDYVWNEGNQFNASEYKRHEIQQLDDLLITTTWKLQ